MFELGNFPLKAFDLFGQFIVLFPHLAENNQYFVTLFSNSLIVLNIGGGQLFKIGVFSAKLAYYILVCHLILGLFILEIIALALQFIEVILSLKCWLGLTVNLVFRKRLFDRSMLHFTYLPYWNLELRIRIVI
jgi:hypothetical protein